MGVPPHRLHAALRVQRDEGAAAREREVHSIAALHMPLESDFAVVACSDEAWCSRGATYGATGGVDLRDGVPRGLAPQIAMEVPFTNP